MTYTGTTSVHEHSNTNMNFLVTKLKKLVTFATVVIQNHITVLGQQGQGTPLQTSYFQRAQLNKL